MNDIHPLAALTQFLKHSKPSFINFTFTFIINWDVRDFRLLPRCRWGLRSSTLLRSVGWQLLTEVSGKYISPTFKGQLILKMRQSVPKRRQVTTNIHHVTTQKSGDLKFGVILDLRFNLIYWP